jgi:DNA-directed RNA polymerase specialized sigma24 family protein
MKKQNPAKAYLMRYRACAAKCAALERAINDALDGAVSITASISGDRVQSSGTGDRVQSAVIKAVDTTAILEEQQKEAERVMAEIMEAIRAVPDEIQQTVLIEKYINGLSLSDIQDCIHYEKRHTITIHGRALWQVWQWMKKRGLCCEGQA